jgi:hypothetical protein
VSGPELERIRARAAAAGVRLGPHLRACALIGSAESVDVIDGLRRTLAHARGALANLNQAGHRGNLLIAAAQAGGTGLDLRGLLDEQRQILALEREIRAWMEETRATLSRIEGRARS